MFVGITNTPRDYPWGSTTAIAGLLGYQPTGKPQAELWLGAHPGSPAEILDPSRTAGAATLADWIAREPATALGSTALAATTLAAPTLVSAPATGNAASNAPGTASELASEPDAEPDAEPRLPFLMKVLAAASPLSLQAHPTPEQARAGFARENAAGVAIDAPFRNYKDAYPKPELMLALSDTFEALCGFRLVADVRATLETLLSSAPAAAQPAITALHGRLADDAALAPTFEWLISRADGVDDLTGHVVEAAAAARAAATTSTAPELLTVLDLAAQYPGDPGIVISLLINRVSLKRGDVLYLPAGNIHAYLEGLGIEVMASSDNVLRGGLTPKHVDVPELLSVLDFTPLPVPYLPAIDIAPGVSEYRPDVPDFVLLDVEGADRSVSYPLAGPAIALVIAGSFTITGAGAHDGDDATSVTVQRGESIYITPDESALAITGSGHLVLASTGN
ncbi:MAG: manA [Glaciihabitans sp.]|nr:manA [Glaciihabitans sp.]